MKDELKLISSKPCNCIENKCNYTYAKAPFDRGEYSSFEDAEIIKQPGDRLKNAALVISDKFKSLPWSKAGHIGKDITLFTLDKTGKLIVFIIADVIPFVAINTFKFVTFIVELLVFFVKDISTEFKRQKPVNVDNDNTDKKTIIINDNHGQINIY